MKKLLSLMSIVFIGTTAFSQCSDLFFSEYLEGSSSNKAFEIYNPTNNAIDLSDYVVYRYNNGSFTATDSLFPIGIIAAGDVFVTANPSANANILALEDTTHTLTFYNGDDAVSLKNIATGDIIDIIGEIGVDPGAGWPVGTGATNNTTLVRKIGVQQGSTNWTIGATEWEVFPIDMVDSLGAHTSIACCVETTASLTETACDSYTSPSGNYVWTNSAIYMDTIPNAAGCDSVLTIDLTVNYETTSSLTETACDSYTSPSGNYVWTSSAIYMDTIPNAAGCDSVLTIDLTVNYETTASLTETACDSYTAPSGNYTWTSSNTYMDTIPNAANCDSVITIELTIINSASGTDTRTECDSLVWIDGITYYVNNNTATFNLAGQAANTCDSLVTLDLTINTLDLSVGQAGDDAMANETGATYQWLNCPAMTEIDGATSQTYTATVNGDYAVVITKNGCTDTSDCVSFLNVGINEEALLNGLSVYPNPTNGEFSIDLGENNASVSIQITDVTGRVIQSNTYNEGQLLNLKLDAPKGVYMLTVESDNKKAVVRLVKK